MPKHSKKYSKKYWGGMHEMNLQCNCTTHDHIKEHVDRELEQNAHLIGEAPAELGHIFSPTIADEFPIAHEPAFEIPSSDEEEHHLEGGRRRRKRKSSKKHGGKKSRKHGGRKSRSRKH